MDGCVVLTLAGRVLLCMLTRIAVYVLRVMGFVNKLISRLGTDDQLDTLTMQLCQRHLDYGALPLHMTVSQTRLRRPVTAYDRESNQTTAPCHCT